MNEYFYIEGGSKVSKKDKNVIGQSKRLVAPKKNYELEKHLGSPQLQLLHMIHTICIEQEGFLG
jgi:hypothetical protein